MLAAFLPAILGASTWTPTCKSSNTGILYPDYNDNSYFYNCVAANKVEHTKCGVVNNVQQVFVYIYQFCVEPQYYIFPPPSSQIDNEINNGGNTTPGTGNPQPSTPGLPTPKYDSTTGKPGTTKASTTPKPSTTPGAGTTTPKGGSTPASTTGGVPQPNQSTSPGVTGGNPTPPGPNTTSKVTTSNVPQPPTPPPQPPTPPGPPNENELSTPRIPTLKPPQPGQK